MNPQVITNEINMEIRIKVVINFKPEYHTSTSAASWIKNVVIMLSLVIVINKWTSCYIDPSNLQLCWIRPNLSQQLCWLHY